MFNQISQRLVQSFGRSGTKMASMPSMSMYQGFRGGVSLFGRPALAPSSLLQRGIWMGSPQKIFPSVSLKNLVMNSPPTAATPSVSSPAPCHSFGIGNISAQQTRGFASKKHKWVIRQSKGFRGRANRCFRIAIRRLEKSWQYAYRDRKVKKREFRKLWIQRLNAGVRQHGISYSRFINMQGKSGVTLDRKILSGLAMYEPFSFKAVVDVVQKMSATSGQGK